MKPRQVLSSVGRKLVYYWKLYAYTEVLILAFIAATAYLEVLVVEQFPPFVLNQVIVAITAVYITVEGVLIGLTPQIKTKLLRNIVVATGIPTLLVSIGTFNIATFQSLQLRYLSTSGTTFSFLNESLLLFVFVELYALALLFPPTRRKENPYATEPEWQVT